jgi:hypothetical protein
VSAPPPGGEGRGGARRILPSVSEVASGLAHLVSADPAVLYRVAREVVSEELLRVKQGLESASLETLVARAQQRFEGTRREVPAVDQPDLFAEAPPGPPRRREPPSEPPMPVLPTLYEAPEAPFAPASTSELGWDPPSRQAPDFAVSSPDSPMVPPQGNEPLERPGSGDEQTLPVEAAEIEMREETEVAATAGPAEEATRRRLWILAVAAFALVAAGVVWILLRILSPVPGVIRTEAPAPVEVTVPPVLPAEPVPTAAPLPAPTAAPAPAPPPPVPKSAVRQTPPAKPAGGSPKSGHVAAFTTKDWAGHSAVYVLHFSSHQDRAAAVSAAARLRKEFGKPAHAVEVNLGAKGIWYRVVVGEFRTADEARAFRAALAAKNTPGMGFVYEMKGAR